MSRLKKSSFASFEVIFQTYETGKIPIILRSNGDEAGFLEILLTM